MKVDRMTLQFFERQEIERLLKEGKSIAEIGRQLERSRSSISLDLRRCGGIHKYSAEEAQRCVDLIRKRRALKLTRSFGDEEKKIIKEGMDQGLSMTDIKEKLGCSFRRLELYFSQNHPQYRGRGLGGVKEQIEGIKQQIDIILDILRSKK